MIHPSILPSSSLHENMSISTAARMSFLFNTSKISKFQWDLNMGGIKFLVAPLRENEAVPSCAAFTKLHLILVLWSFCVHVVKFKHVRVCSA